MMHGLVLIPRQLKGLTNCHYQQRNQEGAPECSYHDDDSSNVRIGYKVTKTHSGDRYNNNPYGLKVAIEIDHTQLPVIFNFKNSKEVRQH
jgi:hypothetical protein